MEDGFGELMSLFKARKFDECLNTVLDLEKQNDLSVGQKKIITDFKIRTYINLNRFSEAHNIFDRAIEIYSKNKDWEKVLENLISKIRMINAEGKFKEALELVEQGELVLKRINKLTAGLIESKGWLLYWRGFVYNWFYKTKESVEYFHVSLDFAEKNALDDIKGQTLHWLGNGYGSLGDYDLALKYQKQALHYFKEIEDEFNIAHLLHNISVIYAEKGEYKKSREYMNKRFKIFGEYPHGIASIGDSYWREGEIEKGLEYMERGLEKAREHFKNAEENPIVQFILANLNGRKGNQEEAMKLYQKILSLDGKTPFRSLIGFSYVGISNIHFHRGELDKAINHAQRALKIFEVFGGKYGMGWAHFVLSKINYEKNDYENALLHAQTCLDLRMAMGNKQDISQSIRFLITFLLEKESFDETDMYLDQLEELVSTTDNRIVKHNYLLSKALILKSKGRPKHWIQAIDFLEEIACEPIADYNTTLVALINLCELLLNEFSISGDEEVLNDLQTHTSRLLDIAQKQNSYTLRVEAYHIRIVTLWLQAQHSKLDINIQNARRLLQEARDLADSHGLIKLASKITTQNDKMLDQLENWDEFIRKYYDFIKT